MVNVVVRRILAEEMERKTYLSMARRLLAFEEKGRTSSILYHQIIRDFLNMAIVPTDDPIGPPVYRLPGKSRPTTSPEKAMNAWKAEVQRIKNLTDAREEAAAGRRNMIRQETPKTA